MTVFQYCPAAEVENVHVASLPSFRPPDGNTPCGRWLALTTLAMLAWLLSWLLLH